MPSSLWVSISHLEGAGVGLHTLSGPLIVIHLLWASHTSHFCEAHLSMWGKSPFLWILLSSLSIPVFLFHFSLHSLCNGLCAVLSADSVQSMGGLFQVSGGGRGAGSGCPGCTRPVSLWGRGGEVRLSSGGGLRACGSMTGPGRVSSLARRESANKPKLGQTCGH